jgi:hypothetical protein
MTTSTEAVIWNFLDESRSPMGPSSGHSLHSAITDSPPERRQSRHLAHHEEVLP